MHRSSWIACSLLVLGYMASTPAMTAADTLTKGVISEDGLACKSATLDVLVPLLRKADPNGHKKTEQALKKGDCIQLSSGTPITIVGKDVGSKFSQSNYLIWHSNGKVYSFSENRVARIAAIAGTSPLTTLPPARAAPAAQGAEASSIERLGPAD